ncbi:hypothetical protein GCM10010218_43750 [Streptomyces mashuensis]|uniref:Uncharacterized protein n=1 Tax=Streptomyces mashuensis TaxID=33904 RepID=A0A919B4Z7_9ACTN|nr:hypothetical protein [Streptomyces mashuensis]GHF57599.1 hypothetical protein GCM10010218_43750 [Streptomyces mashuensis]
MSDREPAAPVAHDRPLDRPLSMHDLLASCAAADAVSTPPEAPRAPAGTDDDTAAQDAPADRNAA